MVGRVVYSSGGNYKVLSNGNVYFAKPLGKFRNDNIKILVGDIVDVQINEDKKGLQELNVITKLHKRKNSFVRPNISNIDNAILVTSINEPDLNDYYLDKLITIFQSKNVEPIIIFTKADLGISKEYKNIINEYINADFKVLVTDMNLSKNNLKKLKTWTKDKLSVITGQTGVGKTTLINLINSNFKLKTQKISKALGRGKHTTRHAEAFEVFDNSFLIDTPGFSSLEISGVDKNEIYKSFFDFNNFYSKCKFNDCSHINEPNCEIKNIYSQDSRIMKNYTKLIKEKNNEK